MSSRLNVDLLTKTLSEILSDKHGLAVSVKAVPKDKAGEAEKGTEAIA